MIEHSNENSSYEIPNAAKATFDEVYNAPTPEAYFTEMNRLGYEIGEQALPYFDAAARLLQRQLGPESSVQALDLGCSYGVGGALLNHDVSFGELARFFREVDTANYDSCVQATREWLADRRSADLQVSYLGLDSAGGAVRFARDAGLIDGGIARNLEEEPRLAPAEAKLVRDCNLLTSTGAIGYVGDRTLSVLLNDLGRSAPDEAGPYSVVTILRMFDPAPIAETVERFGFQFAQVPEVRLRQRRFETEEEQARTLQLLEQRGLNTDGWEADGFLYADLFAAAPAAELPALENCLRETRERLNSTELAEEQN